jgi:DNA polymerase III subunit beta
MRLTIDKASLGKALAHVASVVERRNTIPILSNVLLSARDNELKLTATDLDMELVETVPARAKGEGATTVPAHMFHDIVRKLPEGTDIELARDGEQGRLTITCGPARFSLQTLPADDFPSLSVDDLGHAFTLSAADLKRLIDKTRFAISTEETRYYLNGIYVHAATSGELAVLRAVATDGHRLARFEMPLPLGASEMPGVIVPRKTVGELRKLIDEIDERVDVALSDSRVRFTFGALVLTSKLIDGTFPDYSRVIPANNDKVMKVDRRSFADAVDRVSTISSEKSRAVKLSLRTKALTLSATSAENGSASEELEVDYAGNAMEIGFNARYLLDIAQQIQGEGAQFTLADSASPTVVQDVADGSALYVLMPMRV